ncbi:hypothetical protein MMC06_006609 [Schaereria dolodes]|nr:hypothetical protein [Schaereria dolodes]
MAAVIASDLELQLTVLSHRLCELESSLEYFSEFGIATPANLILGRPRQHDLDSGGEAIKMMKKTREEASEVIKKKTALQRQSDPTYDS